MSFAAPNYLLSFIWDLRSAIWDRAKGPQWYNTPMVYNFNPAAKDEPTVFGSAAPGFPYQRGRGVSGFVSMVQRFGMQRIVCLLTEPQVNEYKDLIERYRDAFGPTRVCWAPMEDHRVADVGILRDTVLPYLADADAAGEKVVVHCLAGLGRTGQALAAWLVYGRGMAVPQAIETVRAMGREPEEAIQHGYADEGDVAAVLAQCTSSPGAHVARLDPSP